MPRFGKRSRANLDTAHPDLHRLFDRVIQLYDCTVLCGHRGMEAQNAAFHAGTSEKMWPDGNHNKRPSRAVDVVPWWPEAPHIRWDGRDAKNRMYYFGGLVKGIAAEMGIKIRWGGDWDSDNDFKDQRLHDLPHFELGRNHG